MNLEKHKAEQKDVWYDFICIQFWERQNYSHKKSRFVGAEDLGSGEGIDCTGGSRNFFFFGDSNVLYLGCDCDYKTVYN